MDTSTNDDAFLESGEEKELLQRYRAPKPRLCFSQPLVPEKHTERIYRLALVRSTESSEDAEREQSMSVKQVVMVTILLLVTNAIFGGWSVVGKLTLQNTKMKPLIFAFYRELLSGPILCAAGAIVEGGKPKLIHVPSFLFLGFIGFFLGPVAYLMALSFVSADTVSFFQPITPIFTLVIAMVIKSETTSLLKIVGVFVSAAGAALLVAANGVSFQNDAFMGIVLITIQTVSGAFYFTMQKPLVKQYPPISVTGWLYLIASLLTVLISVAYYANDWTYFQISQEAVWGLLYAVFLATCVTYVLLTYTNSIAPSSYVTAFSITQPVWAGLLAYLFLDERLSLQMILGGLFVVSGLMIVTFQRWRDSILEQKIVEELAVVIKTSSSGDIQDQF